MPTAVHASYRPLWFAYRQIQAQKACGIAAQDVGLLFRAEEIRSYNRTDSSFDLSGKIGAKYDAFGKPALHHAAQVSIVTGTRYHAFRLESSHIDVKVWMRIQHRNHGV